jgi:serine/threonine protein kinase/WD40 repeat protein
MPDLRGFTLGRYAIIELLGSGGMASVYKAFDEILDRAVAIKVIRAEAFSPSQADQLLKRFQREARVLARLKHNHIVKVYDAGEHQGAPYLVLEYLSGGTLKDRMGKAVPFPHAASMLLPVARALDYAHQCGVLHRDLKPANILMNENGEPVLTDFGIARLLTIEDGQNLTMTGFGIGTPEYMAPEQGMGLEVDARADIYALGVVLYEMVTGRRPFSANTPMAVIFKHVHDPLPDPRTYVPELPESLVDMLYRSLAKQAAQRFDSAADFVAGLEDLAKLGNESPEETPPFKPASTRQEPQTANTVDEPSPAEEVPQIASLEPSLSPEKIDKLLPGEDILEQLDLETQLSPDQTSLGEVVPDQGDLIPPFTPDLDVDSISREDLHGANFETQVSPDTGGETAYAPVAPLPSAPQTVEQTHRQPRIPKRNLYLLAGLVGALALVFTLAFLALQGGGKPVETPALISAAGASPVPILTQPPSPAPTGSPAAELLATDVVARPAVTAGPTPTMVWNRSSLEHPLPASLNTLTDDNIDRIQVLSLWGGGVIESAAWSPDGAWQAISSARGVYMYSADGSSNFLISTAGWATSAYFDPFSTLLYIGLRDGSIQTYELQPGTLSSPLQAHSKAVTEIISSPDGRYFASRANTIRLWDALTMREMHTQPGESMAFSPDGERLAIGLRSGEVQLIATADGQPLGSLQFQDANRVVITALAYRDGGQTLAALSANGKLWFWKGDQESHLIDLAPEFSGMIERAAFSPDGELLAVYGLPQGKITVFSVRDGSALYHAEGPVDSLAFSPANFLSGVSRQEDSVRVWSPDGAQQILLKDFTGGSTNNVLFLPQSQGLAVTGTDGLIYILNGANGRVERVLTGHSGRISSLSAAADGRLLASAGYEDQQVYVWDLETGQVAHSFKTEKQPYASMTSNGKLLAIAANDEIRLISLPEGQFVKRYKAECPTPSTQSCMTSIALSPDGSLLAGYVVGNVYLWKTAEQELFTKFQGLSKAFSVDGILAVGRYDQDGSLWSLDRGEYGSLVGGPFQTEEKPIYNSAHVTALAFSPDGKLIAGGMQPSQTGIPNLKIWSAEYGTELVTIDISGFQARIVGKNFSFSHDGKLLAVGLEDGTILIYGVP